MATPLGKGKGMMVPFDGLTWEERGDHQADGKIDHVTRGLVYVPYSNTPWLLAANFRARTTVVTTDYNLDESVETTSIATSSSSELPESEATVEWEPPLKWVKLQHDEENDKHTPSMYEIP